MKCPTCESCEYEQYCGATEIMRKCERHNKKVEQTNEEWFTSLSTEEKAEWFGKWHSFSCVFCKHWRNGCVYNHNQVLCAIEEGKSNKELWMEWLKQSHTLPRRGE